MPPGQHGQFTVDQEGHLAALASMCAMTTAELQAWFREMSESYPASIQIVQLRNIIHLRLAASIETSYKASLKSYKASLTTTDHAIELLRASLESLESEPRSRAQMSAQQRELLNCLREE